MNKGDLWSYDGADAEKQNNSAKDHVNTKAEIVYFELSVILDHVILVF